MALAQGSRIGPYEITSQIGKGGMGEVYRAVDSNLGRAVAIKVLPESVSRDPERLARFDREARTLASLNHPNIAQIFGLERSTAADHSVALVMEMVEGPTLADRTAAGAIPLDEAIPIALQIAEALENAHDHGIVHRDLKPANIKVRNDGTVKVLDFGLAKAMAPADPLSSAISDSPTLTTPAMTHAGVVMGTAAYMSPEQAKGRVVDRRADIWAFGCVLYEMLARKRAFGADDVTDVVVAVLRDEPDWSALPTSTPPHVRALLKRCFQKDVRKRLPHIGMVRLELSEPSPAVSSSPSRGRWPLIAAAIAVMAFALGAASMSWRSASTAPMPPMRLAVDFGLEPNIVPTQAIPAFAPDGQLLAFTARPANNDAAATGLYIRHMDRLNAELLPGTEGAGAPFFSPDGKWVGFFAAGTMKKIEVGGGPALAITAAPVQRGAFWSNDDTIVFGSIDGLTRVQASGGNSQVILKAVPNQPLPAWPQLLPGGKAVLFSETLSSDPNASSIKVLDLSNGSVRNVMQGARSPRYTSSGHLVYTRSGTILAVPFDLDRLEAIGEGVPVIEGIATTIIGGLALAAVSSGGAVAYMPGPAGESRQAPIMWLTKTGALAPLRSTPTTWAFPHFSPDGRRISMTQFDGRQSDIWIYDIERDIATRVTTDPSSDMDGIFTPDGMGLVFASNRIGNVANLFWQRADGTGEAVRLTESTIAQLPDAISPDGRQVVMHQGDPATQRQSVTMVPLELRPGESPKAGPLQELIGGRFLKANARISPDGKWIAYSTNESGIFEIYVQPFPSGGSRVQVSSGGGNLAVWSPKRNELFYVGAGQGRLSVVPYSINAGVFTPAKSQVWSQTAFSSAPPISTYGPAFDIHPDGERFAVAPPLAPVAAGRASQIVLFFNFFDELRRVAPIR